MNRLQGQIVRKPVNANLGLNVNRSSHFASIKTFLTTVLCVVRDFSNSKLKGKQCKQKTSPKNYQTQMKILANPGLAYSRFEQPGPLARFSKAPETFRARKAIFSSAVFKNGEAYIPATFCTKRSSVHVKNTGVNKIAL